MWHWGLNPEPPELEAYAQLIELSRQLLVEINEIHVLVEIIEIHVDIFRTYLSICIKAYM